VSESMIDGIYIVAERAERYPHEDDVARLRERAIALTEQAGAAMSRSATATDPTGLVEATVRADGTVEAVYISPRAVRDLSPQRLGAACVAAVTAARTAIATELAQWLAELHRPAGAGG
jgi:DNA-binding protein YbaB